MDIPPDHPCLIDRECIDCGEFFSHENFPKFRHKTSYGGYLTCNRCIACEKYRKRSSHLKSKYGITPEDYDRMVEEQNGRCYLCDELPSDKFGKLVIDHCHKTGEVRKLLCRMCNIHLTKIEACPEYFDKVISYLKGK